MNATAYTPWGEVPLEDAFVPTGWVDRELEAAPTIYPHSNDNTPPAPATAPPADIKAEIADEAKRIVSGARRAAYGPPEDNFARIARFWTAYFENTGRDVVVTPADVSPMMRLMKEARLCETPDHRDSFVDIIGYAMCGYELEHKLAATRGKD